MKSRILLIGLYIPAYGFTRVLQHITNALKADFELHYLGIGYHVRELKKMVLPYIRD